MTALLLAFATGVVALALKLWDVVDRWRAKRTPAAPPHPPPHPLLGVLHELRFQLADIAAAIRERAPDLHVVLPDVPAGQHGPGPRPVPPPTPPGPTDPRR